jgi:hypothetical protein
MVINMNIPDNLHPKLHKLFTTAFDKGMSLRQIAKLAGFSHNLPCIWLKGGTVPITDKLEAAEKAVRLYKPKKVVGV